MKEPVVSFKTARLAKEKQFNEPCYKYYEHSLNQQVHKEDGTSGPFGWEKGETILQSDFFINNYKDSDFSNKSWYWCAAPTQEFLKKWLRLKHGIHIDLVFDDNCWTGYFGEFTIPDLALDNQVHLEEKDSYKESLEAYEEIFDLTLQYALKLI
jgi:hypothetical protein